MFANRVQDMVEKHGTTLTRIPYGGKDTAEPWEAQTSGAGISFKGAVVPLGTSVTNSQFIAIQAQRATHAIVTQTDGFAIGDTIVINGENYNLVWIERAEHKGAFVSNRLYLEA